MKIKHYLLHLVLQLGRNREKKNGPLLGARFRVVRDGRKPVETYLYTPKKAVREPMPVMFNVHGGGWVGCDATMLDTQSLYLADLLGCFVVNINYTKLDAKPFPYAQEELRDTVLYFRDHAGEYSLDANRFSLIGYSAGGHLCAGAAMLLRDAGVSLSSQFLCYPFLDFKAFYEGDQGVEGDELKKAADLMDQMFFVRMNKGEPLLSPGCAQPAALKGLAPVELITCGEDWLLSHSARYEHLLIQAEVPVARRDFDGSVHGFLEANFPETNGKNAAKSPEQEALMKKAFAYIRKQAHHYWNIQEV